MDWLDRIRLQHYGWIDLLDVLLVTFLLYKLYGLIRGTVAVRVFIGVLAFYVLWLIVSALDMHMTSEIFRQVINVGVIALIVVFQQEIRRFLVSIGNSDYLKRIGFGAGWFSRLMNAPAEKPLSVDSLCEAIFTLSRSRTGALVVIERVALLDEVERSGRPLHAELGPALIESVFFKNSPLHDGALLIRGNQSVAASCVLPVTKRAEHPPQFGMRHKAALGLSEECDAVVIVVSEETGEVALVHEGELRSCASSSALKKMLNVLLR